MTSLREFVRRWVTGRPGLQPTRAAPGPGGPGAELQPAFSYRLYWTKVARDWSPERRIHVLEAVRARVRAADFEANAYERRFAVPGLDEQAHSGLSLLALIEVLVALETHAGAGG